MSRHHRLILPLLLVLAALALPAAANATAPAQLWMVPENGPGQGSAAGEIGSPAGLDASPLSGDVYVADLGNSRIAQFSAWGEFISAFGWGVRNGADEPQICTATTGCQAGIEGAGPGQFDGPAGVAFDSAGDIFVSDYGNNRIQKLDPEGHFILMFGGGVNKTTGADVCTAASGDVCGVGSKGGELGEFTWSESLVKYGSIAVAPGGEVYVGDENRIQIFNSDGVYQSQIGLPKEGEVAGGAPDGEAMAGALAIDGSGNLYADLANSTASEHYRDVFKYSSSHWSVFAHPAEPLGEEERSDPPLGLAVDDAGNLYVAAEGQAINRVFEYDSGGAKLIPDKAEEEDRDFAHELNRFGSFSTAGGEFMEVMGLATSGGACGIPGGGLYATFSEYGGADNLLVAFGETPDPALCPPPRNPPAIVEQFATAVGSHEATLRARINSRFWTTTTYFLEVGTEPCSLGGCQSTQQLRLNSSVNAPVLTKGIFVPGLQPGTTYYYRFVAATCYETKSGSEECETGQEARVAGAGGTPATDGAEGEFTTSEPTLPPRESCSNQSFRTGPAALLPDCRAYEMVSPIDKEGSDIVALINATGFPARLDQSATSGEKFTYSAYRPFAGSAAGNTSSQYMAGREAGVGWSTRPVSPPIGRSLLAPGANVEREYGLFSDDLCQGWLRSNYKAEPVLDPAAVPDFPNLYSSDLCGDGGYEAISTLAPPHVTADSYAPLQVQGSSADGSVTLYSANDNLTPEAPELPKHQSENGLYVRGTDGTTRFVCYLPSGAVSNETCGPGAGNRSSEPRYSQVDGAISADGGKVYFTTGSRLYVRLNPTQPQSTVEEGHCTEEEMGCTIAIPNAATYWAATPDGDKVLFATSGGSLREYDLEEGITTTIAGSGLVGVMGQSTDLSRVYFVSTAKLATGSVTGKPNLYLYEAGAGSRYVTELDAVDVLTGQTAAVALEPIFRASRVSPDGLTAAFVSWGSETGYDNTDAQTGKADAEVFLYSAQAEEGAGALACVSCDPTGARPSGVVLKDKPWENRSVAAYIPTWETSLYPSRVLAMDGSRLIFNSVVPLVSRDTNGRQDVYEWEAGGSKSACEALGAERYVAGTRGCISLISSGESSLDSEFLDASPSGRDVFFTTASSLLPQDPGLIDVYDAREGGGVPEPPKPPAGCEGEACQSPPAAPNDPTPASSAFRGPGNVQEAPGKHKHKKKHKKHKKKHGKHGKHGRNHHANGRKHR